MHAGLGACLFEIVVGGGGSVANAGGRGVGDGGIGGVVCGSGVGVTGGRGEGDSGTGGGGGCAVVGVLVCGKSGGDMVVMMVVVTECAVIATRG